MSTAKNNYSGTGNVPPEKSSFKKTFNRLRKPEISPPRTIDFLSNMENTVQKSTKPEKLINLPQYVNLDCLVGEPNTKMETKTAKMTIIYQGKVMVFDNISGDKARDLILAANCASNYNNQIQNRGQLVSTSYSSYEGFISQEDILSGLQENGSGLPIARRVSLHKFLAKRKERTNVRATPYELHNSRVESSSKYKFDLNL